MAELAESLMALTVLAEPQRARIYGHLAAAVEPCTQQDLAAALGIGRTLVAFHLDKLLSAGLVQVVPRTGEAPGGRGRPPQRYAVSDREWSAAVPPRRYDLMAEVLVQAASAHTAPEPLQITAHRVATDRGRQLAEDQRSNLEGSHWDEALTTLLTQLGYEPRREGDVILLTNCPFDRLREYDLELVCSINAALAAGYLDGLHIADRVTPRLRPCPLNCCVLLEPTR